MLVEVSAFASVPCGHLICLQQNRIAMRTGFSFVVCPVGTKCHGPVCFASGHVVPSVLGTVADLSRRNMVKAEGIQPRSGDV